MVSYISVRHHFSPIFSDFFIAFACSLQFINKTACFRSEITHFFHNYIQCPWVKETSSRPFPIKFPSFSVSSLFSLYKYFYFIAASFFHCFSFLNSMSRFARCDISPYDDVIWRSCCSAMLIHSSSFCNLSYPKIRSGDRGIWSENLRFLSRRRIYIRREGENGDRK